MATPTTGNQSTSTGPADRAGAKWPTCGVPGLCRLARILQEEHQPHESGLCACGEFFPCFTWQIAERELLHALGQVAIGRWPTDPTKIMPGGPHPWSPPAPECDNP